MRAFRLVGFVLITALFGALVPSAAIAQLTEQRTPGLRLLFIDGSETFLVPHATRTALNSLAFQKKLFGFDPKEDVTILLVDLSDKGNAGASTVPERSGHRPDRADRLHLRDDRANERMNTLMNHELVHIATMDQAAGRGPDASGACSAARSCRWPNSPSRSSTSI